MDLFTGLLLLCSALALVSGAPAHSEHSAAEEGAAVPDRCDGIEFDAITPDENGKTFFFKGAYLWKGFNGPAQVSTEFFKEMDDTHNSGHVDAAFRMHSSKNPEDQDHMYFFLDDKVFRYYNLTLTAGYPKDIQEDFPGVPSHLDAAVECPAGECMADSVLFFKGHDVHVYDIDTKTVKTKTWSHLPVCTSVLRWLEHYYCFHGHNFTRFNPLLGDVKGPYPKDSRNYFMSCDNFGHGGKYRTPKCSEIKLDAITTDDKGKKYMFAGPIYMRLDTHRDGLHAFPITRMWSEMVRGVDAVFSYSDKLYMIKDEEVFIYKEGANHTLVEGYPKTLNEELGFEGHVDAAFVCPNEHWLYVIKGKQMLKIDLTATPRAVTEDLPIPLSDIDAGFCDSEGVLVFKGSQYYNYDSPMILAKGRMAPVPENITPDMMGCHE
nr:PREDICTED: hemopexin-like [Paralichthys olivaceus]